MTILMRGFQKQKMLVIPRELLNSCERTSSEQSLHTWEFVEMTPMDPFKPLSISHRHPPLAREDNTVNGRFEGDANDAHGHRGGKGRSVVRTYEPVRLGHYLLKRDARRRRVQQQGSWNGRIYSLRHLLSREIVEWMMETPPPTGCACILTWFPLRLRESSNFCYSTYLKQKLQATKVTAIYTLG